MLCKSLDCNQDQVVSAKEFRNWLIPHNMNAVLHNDTTSLAEKEKAIKMILSLIKTVYNDDMVLFFDALDR